MTQTAKEKRKDKYWLLRWGLSMVLVVWAFILGVLVGQGSLANDQQLESLRKLSLSWFGISFYQEEKSAQDPLLDPDLSFYEQLASRPANNSNPPVVPPAAQPAQPEQTTQPPVPLPGNAGEEAPASPVAPSPAISEQPSPAAAPPEAQPPASQAASSVPLNQVRPYQPDAPVTASSNSASRPVVQSAAIPSGRFTVQAGSFQDERQALELSNRLRRGGFAAYVSRINIEGVGLRLRVRVGGYDNLEQAQNVAASLRSKENIAAYVTRND